MKRFDNSAVVNDGVTRSGHSAFDLFERHNLRQGKTRPHYGTKNNCTDKKNLSQ